MRAGNTRGFALPVTIFLVTLLTITLATGFARVSADLRMGTSSEQIVDALTVAQSGLQVYLGTQTARPPDGDSVRINVPNGYAWVVANIIQRPADTLQPQMYVVRSTGYVVEPTISSEPIARRTVAQFAQWQTGWIDAQAALTALNRVRRSSGGGPPSEYAGDLDTLSGIDACGEVPPLGSVWTSNYVDAAPNPVDDPVFLPTAPDQSPVSTAIDWPATIGSGLIPDYTAIQVGSNEWAIQRVEGDAVLTDGSGTGLLIVTGTLDFRGASASWEGVILVGEDLDFEAGINRVDGLVVTGLNGSVSSFTEFGTANVRLMMNYSSCNVTRALAPLTGFAAVPNAWIDNWATY